MKKLLVKLIDSSCQPKKASKNAVGYDFYAKNSMTVPGYSIVKIALGCIVKPPRGYYLQLRGRSSLEWQGLVGIAGVIDPDYCGPEDELMFMAVNVTPDPIEILLYSRVCQGILLKYSSAEVAVIDPTKELSTKSRGGFGSTGRI